MASSVVRSDAFGAPSSKSALMTLEPASYDGLRIEPSHTATAKVSDAKMPLTSRYLCFIACLLSILP